MLVAGDGIITLAKNAVIRGDRAVLEAGQCDKGLYNRSGRVGTAQRSIEQRFVDIVLQGQVFFIAHAPGAEPVWIETGLADQCENVAVVDIDDDHGTAPARKRSFGNGLQVAVQAQDQVAARHRFLAIAQQFLTCFAPGIHLAALRVDQ